MKVLTPCKFNTLDRLSGNAKCLVLILVPTLALIQNTSACLQCCSAASFLSVFNTGSSVWLLSLVPLLLPVPLPVSPLQFGLKTPPHSQLLPLNATGWPITIWHSDNQTSRQCPQSDDVISARARARARVLSSPPGQGFPNQAWLPVWDLLGIMWWGVFGGGRKSEL